MDLSSFEIAPSLGQRPVKAGNESRVTFRVGQNDNDICSCRQWLKDNPDPEGRVPEDFPYVSFLRTMSEDGEEITKVLPVLPESDQWWLKYKGLRKPFRTGGRASRDTGVPQMHTHGETEEV